MARNRHQEIRRSKKKAQYLRELSTFLTHISQDESALAQLYITRVELSSDGGMCYAYVTFCNAWSEEEKEASYKTARDVLILYKPSIRRALASSLHSRYVPDIRFVFDDKKEKEHRVTDLLTQVSDELASFDEKNGDDLGDKE
jgi:ribosome-binding factor A